MKEQKIKDLLDSMFSLKYDWKSGDISYRSDVINKEGRIIVEQMIRNFALENRDEQFGILEGKVFLYEEIISKSNFAPMIKRIKSKKTVK